ncbi:hypothetical protein HanXRQr2_Chr10g0441961 [Helianthus annuus]|uniref:Uncharacterized protein n=1 Tax=Helianthus annuus TaxID=4232 RepID=A0A9K3HYA7_HELAN|nr:hypothetical protein HanXRQr2_Chr10g0441961 [Helianthus annuus]
MYVLPFKHNVQLIHTQSSKFIHSSSNASTIQHGVFKLNIKHVIITFYSLHLTTIHHFLSHIFKHSHTCMIPNIINISESSIYITSSKTHFITTC